VPLGRAAASREGTPAPPRPAAAQAREERRRRAEQRNARSRKLSPVRKRLEDLEEEIETLTRKARDMEAEMANPDFYQERERFAETFKAYGALKAVIESKTQRWEELTLELEKLEQQLARP
jgi:ATP-binding cassette subfamily F protein 3